MRVQPRAELSRLKMIRTQERLHLATVTISPPLYLVGVMEMVVRVFLSTVTISPLYCTWYG